MQERVMIITHHLYFRYNCLIQRQANDLFIPQIPWSNDLVIVRLFTSLADGNVMVQSCEHALDFQILNAYENWIFIQILSIKLYNFEFYTPPPPVFHLMGIKWFPSEGVGRSHEETRGKVRERQRERDFFRTLRLQRIRLRKCRTCRIVMGCKCTDAATHAIHRRHSGLGWKQPLVQRQCCSGKSAERGVKEHARTGLGKRTSWSSNAKKASIKTLIYVSEYLTHCKQVCNSVHGSVEPMV